MFHSSDFQMLRIKFTSFAIICISLILFLYARDNDHLIWIYLKLVYIQEILEENVQEKEGQGVVF
jgi:hypothetical protein